MTIERKQPKPKTCKNPDCRASFVPQRLGQAVCNYTCGLAIKDVNANKARKAIADVGRKELRAAKERVKPKGQYMREAQAAFNAWVRLRDAALGCVSCNKPATWDGQWHASHFRSVGSSPEHRFNPLNVHRACSVCNNHLSGNILGYQPELIRRIGAEAVEALLGPSEPKRYTIDDLKAITADYRAKTRELKRAAA
ncbi:recombination protein NinG [Pseudomonas lundensis]|uniref:recombination protein NinG n=1 Tax=Pseudomonas lundensis TaxID=86185 RepID=UPI0015C73D30|nr:recombination protein NinG [Pseudomonas lundensis]